MGALVGEIGALAMPEDSLDQVSDKLTCFIAENIELRRVVEKVLPEKIRMSRMQLEINKEHINSLILKKAIFIKSDIIKREAACAAVHDAPAV